MTVTVSKWGNSQGLRLPKDIVKKLDLAIGDVLEVTTENNKVILEPVKKKKKYSINELVKNIPYDYKPTEEFNSPMGNEVW